MTNEELDDAVALEAVRICEGGKPMGLRFRELAQTAARLALCRGWRPEVSQSNNQPATVLIAPSPPFGNVRRLWRTRKS
jgi:hypothetical protein